MHRAQAMAFVFFALVFQTAWPQDTQKVEFFETRIRPVLVEHCYECHNSVDAKEGDLSLDHKAAVLAGGAEGKIVVPGNATKSRLIAILKHEIEDLEMPESGPKLSDSVIADFERWINEGAIDPRDKPPSEEEIVAATSWESIRNRRKKWWSFQPIKPSQPPGAGHAIDGFVNAKIQAAGITAAQPAESSVLVRRLFFTLIGLPPTPEQATTWTEKMDSADVGERGLVVEALIDELIESPRFGERWARHWMDWIRYAESHGSEGDPRIDNAWMYRDYLIRALNEDVPYNQLVREHVAGDLLEDPRINRELGINESMIGPAHWRMVFHGFAPTDALDERVRFTDDQINAFSKAFLGITISCARCHNHKFDAISQKDYYALFGVLASCRPARAVIDVPEKTLTNRDDLQKLKPQIRKAIATEWLKQSKRTQQLLISRSKSVSKEKKKDSSPITDFVSAVRKDTKAWQARSREYQADRDARRDSTIEWDLAEPDSLKTWFREGIGLDAGASGPGEFAVAAEGGSVLQGIYPGGVYSHLLSAKHPARLTSGDFKIGEKSELWVQVIGDKQARVRYAVQDYPRNGTVYPVTNLPNQWRWQRYDLAYWSGDEAHIELAAGKDIPLLTKNENRSWFGVRRALVQPIGHPAPQSKHEFIGLLLSGDAPKDFDAFAAGFQDKLAETIQAWADDKASNEQALFLDACVREGFLANNLGELPNCKTLIERYRELENAIPVPTRVPGLDETVASDWPLYLRGNHKTPSDTVPRRFLEAIDPTPFQTQQSGRRELADKLVDPSNPFVRRVIVNRLWHHLFGRGIAGTPDNLGRMGMKPTHPELLDYLANRFSKEGWSIKKMIRLIVTSQTWQRSAQKPKGIGELDPNNELLSHAHVRRLEAEAIRDAMLAVSGKIDNRLYGPPVDVRATRRSVYMRVIRNSLNPFMRVFDFPEPFSTTGRRDVTNVPAQSLTMMNDPVVQQHARQWSTELLQDKTLRSVKDRVDQMFLMAFGRHANDQEIEQVQSYFAEADQRVQEHRQRSDALANSIREGHSKVDTILSPVRERLEKNSQQKPHDSTAGPRPIGQWDFSKGAKDLIGDAHCILNRGAKIQGGALIVNGKGYATTVPIKTNVKAKTLEAWVQLDDLNQRAGGVITLQTPSGGVFDSIVYAERDARQWMAGSNGFSRTEGFNAPQETDADKKPVHLAIVYQSDGQIIGYRNGVPYGKGYRGGGPIEYKAGEAILSFGVRHLPANGGRMLRGKIFKANLYDRALTPKEVAFTSGASPSLITDKEIMSQLSPAQREEVTKLRSDIKRNEQTLSELGKPPLAGEEQVWTDLAQAMFTFKEFIFLK